MNHKKGRRCSAIALSNAKHMHPILQNTPNQNLLSHVKTVERIGLPKHSKQFILQFAQTGYELSKDDTFFCTLML
jgi:hypothetical protein